MAYRCRSLKILTSVISSHGKNTNLEAPHQLVINTGAATMDWNDGDAQKLKLTSDVTLAIANPRHTFAVLTVIHDTVARNLTINNRDHSRR